MYRSNCSAPAQKHVAAAIATNTRHPTESPGRNATDTFHPAAAHHANQNTTCLDIPLNLLPDVYVAYRQLPQFYP